MRRERATWTEADAQSEGERATAPDGGVERAVLGSPTHMSRDRRRLKASVDEKVDGQIFKDGHGPHGMFCVLNHYCRVWSSASEEKAERIRERAVPETNRVFLPALK